MHANDNPQQSTVDPVIIQEIKDNYRRIAIYWFRAAASQVEAGNLELVERCIRRAREALKAMGQ